MLVEGSGHADSLALTTRQVDALSPKGRKGHALISLRRDCPGTYSTVSSLGWRPALSISLFPPHFAERRHLYMFPEFSGKWGI